MYASKIIALLAISAPIALAAPSADLVARKDGKNFATPGDSCNLPTVIVCSHDQTKTVCLPPLPFQMITHNFPTYHMLPCVVNDVV